MWAFSGTHDFSHLRFFRGKKPISAKMKFNKLSEELREIMRGEARNRTHEIVNPDWLQPYLEKNCLSGLTFEGLLNKNGERTFLVKLRFQLLVLFFFEREKNPYKCSDETCNRKLSFKNGHPYFKCEGVNQYKKFLIMQHCSTHHLTAEEKSDAPAPKKRKHTQMTISMKRSIDSQVIEKIRLLKVELLAELGLSFRQVASDVFRSYEKALWECSTGDSSDLDRIACSRSEF